MFGRKKQKEAPITIVHKFHSSERVPLLDDNGKVILMVDGKTPRTHRVPTVRNVYTRVRRVFYAKDRCQSKYTPEILLKRFKKKYPGIIGKTIKELVDEGLMHESQLDD